MPVPRPVRVMVKIPMGYGRITHADRGQIIELEGMPNDDRLLKLGYVTKIGTKDETYECSECGAPFASMGYRSAHAMMRHPGRELTDDEIDKLEDRLQGQLDTEMKAGTLVHLAE